MDDLLKRLKEFILYQADIDLAKSFILDYHSRTESGNKERDDRTCAMYNLSVIVSYCRPFKKDNNGILSGEFIEFSTPDLQKLHKKLIDLRDTTFAHSDRDLNSVQIKKNNAKNA